MVPAAKDKIQNDGNNFNIWVLRKCFIEWEDFLEGWFGIDCKDGV